MEPLTTQPLGERVAGAMRKAILNGELQPGEELRQEHLAGRFGMPRIPLREAFQLLEDSLMTAEPTSGSFCRPVVNRNLALHRSSERECL